MSEKLYAFFLRLYPAHFRKEYGDEALQLFRDRSRDEKGFLPRLRLWLDLLFDVTVSLPNEYFHLPAPNTVISVPRRLNGVPTFHVLQDRPVRPGALLSGGVLSFVALSTCWLSLNSAISPYHSASNQPASSWTSRESASTESSYSYAKDSGSAGRYAMKDNQLSPAERKHLVAGAISNLKSHYYDREAAQKIAAALAAHEKRGDYDSILDGAAFASLLTQHMREVVPDRHLTFDFFQDSSSPPPPAQTSSQLEQYLSATRAQNCTFEKVELLPPNVGYLKFNLFPDPEVCRVAAMAAMTYINHADAVIFDLRDNRGGYPGMVQFVGSYLFDHPEYWYNPREATTEHSWTQSPVSGSNLADKPVLVLISARTFSGAEQFAYDLKMLKRATLVGETTAGAAHAGVFHRLDDHFGMGIPEVKAINPYSTGDWAEVGVEPDIKVSDASALDVALKLVRSRLAKK
jgi:hypothetical protein